jgi:hypothetical protein
MKFSVRDISTGLKRAFQTVKKLLTNELRYDILYAQRDTVPKRTRMREWLSGRALPCQGRCRGFESRLPLFFGDVAKW